jgi:hypothetical protein
MSFERCRIVKTMKVTGAQLKLEYFEIKVKVYIRLERFCMGKFQTQKLIRPIVLKDADTY